MGNSTAPSPNVKGFRPTCIISLTVKRDVGVREVSLVRESVGDFGWFQSLISLCAVLYRTVPYRTVPYHVSLFVRRSA